VLALGFRPIQPEQRALSKSFALELRDRREDTERHPTGWRSRVESFPERHKSYIERPQFIEQQHQMSHRPSKAIQLPRDHCVEPLATNGCEHSVKLRTLVLRAADAVLDELRCLPSTCGDVSAQFVDLITRILIEATDVLANAEMRPRPNV
jgi:hypothetical protein